MRLPSSNLRACRSRFWIAALLMVGCKSTPGAKAPADAEIGTGGAAAGVGGAVSGTGGAGGAASGAGGASGGVGGGSGGAGLGGAAGSHGTGGTGMGGSPAKDAGSGFVDAGPDPGTDGDGDFTIGPTYTISPDLMTQNVPHGRSFTFTMSSTTSAIYTGLDPTLLAANQHSFTRQVRVYVPMQYVDGTAAPFMVVQDGFLADISTALDNLIANGRLPPIVAVFVANGGGDSIGSERGLEYDTMSGTYARFIDSEVLPAVASNAQLKAAYPNFKLTTDPNGRAAYGCSSGGAAAMTMGWFAPNDYRRLITYSGTFVDQQNPIAPEQAQYPVGAWGYASGLIANSPVQPLRVFLQAGEMDNGSTMPESSLHNWVLANQHVAAALKAKGYHYRFIFALGATHCDARPRQQTLPETLLWMWRGYTPN
jgi:iron(III)-enterobactin esterase